MNRHVSDGWCCTRSYLKKVFSPGIGVESLSQDLDILEYACGLILGLALISNENPNFEIASKRIADLFVETTIV
jgi:hypothetical protein